MICCQVSVSGLKVYLWGSSVRLKSLSDLEIILLALLTQTMYFVTNVFWQFVFCFFVFCCVCILEFLYFVMFVFWRCILLCLYYGTFIFCHGFIDSDVQVATALKSVLLSKRSKIISHENVTPNSGFVFIYVQCTVHCQSCLSKLMPL